MKKAKITIDEFGDVFGEIEISFKMKVHMGNKDEQNIDIDNISKEEVFDKLDDVESMEIVDEALSAMREENVL